MRKGTRASLLISFGLILLAIGILLAFLPHSAMTANADNLVFDTSSISFFDKKVTFDNQEKGIYLTGVIPNGIEVSYDNNIHTNAGEYFATATISCPSGSITIVGNDTFEAKLTIEKAVIDLSQMQFLDKCVVYDGLPHTLRAQNVPTGISVSYDNENCINANIYKINAVLNYDAANYCLYAHGVEVTDNIMTASLTIYKQQSVIIPQADIYTFVYDGAPKKLSITTVGESVADVKFYINGVLSDNRFLDVGTYKVTMVTKGNFNHIKAEAVSVTVHIKKPTLTNSERKLLNNEINGKLMYAGGFLDSATLYIGKSNHKFPPQSFNTRNLGSYIARVQGDEVPGGITVILDCVKGANPRVIMRDGDNYITIKASYNDQGQLVFVTDNLGEFMVICDNTLILPMVILFAILLLLLLIGGIMALINLIPHKIHFIIYDKETTAYVAPNETLILPKPVGTLYESFDGWYLDKSYTRKALSPMAMPKRAVKLYAKFTVRNLPY